VRIFITLMSWAGIFLGMSGDYPGVDVPRNFLGRGVDYSHNALSLKHSDMGRCPEGRSRAGVQAASASLGELQVPTCTFNGYDLGHHG